MANVPFHLLELPKTAEHFTQKPEVVAVHDNGHPYLLHHLALSFHFFDKLFIWFKCSNEYKFQLIQIHLIPTLNCHRSVKIVGIASTPKEQAENYQVEILWNLETQTGRILSAIKLEGVAQIKLIKTE